MDKGIALYKEFIDYFVQLSRSCVNADNLKTEQNTVAIKKIKPILDKLSCDEKDELAQYVLESYCDGIFDALDYLEWLRCCRNMTIEIDGCKLNMDEFEGLSSDFIGKRNI